jgi:hypothetical protein
VHKKCGVRSTSADGSGWTEDVICRACITQTIRHPHCLSAAHRNRRCGFLDDAVLDAQHIIEMISTGSNAIFKTMKKLHVTTAHIRMILRGPRGTRCPCDPFVQPQFDGR